MSSHPFLLIFLVFSKCKFYRFEIIENRNNLGLSLDYSINSEFENKTKHKNFIFANGVDFIHEFFNFERKIQNNTLSKSIQFLGKQP